MTVQVIYLVSYFKKRAQGKRLCSLCGIFLRLKIVLVEKAESGALIASQASRADQPEKDSTFPYYLYIGIS
jgi:hypothetical protein